MPFRQLRVRSCLKTAAIALSLVHIFILISFQVLAPLRRGSLFSSYKQPWRAGQRRASVPAPSDSYPEMGGVCAWAVYSLTRKSHRPFY